MERGQWETPGAPIAWWALNMMLVVGTWGSSSSWGAVEAGLGWAVRGHVPVQGPWLSSMGPRGVSMVSLWTSVPSGQMVFQLCTWAALQSEVHGLDVAPWEETNVPAEPASPPVGVQVLHDLNDVTAAEAEL